MATDDFVTQMAVDVGSLYHLLTVALPYVEKVVATSPTEPLRQRRQRQAANDAKTIREKLDDLEKRNPGFKARAA